MRLFCSVPVMSILCTFAVPTPIGVTGTQKRDLRSAAQILDAMVQTYERCKSYSDSGVTKTVFTSQNQPTFTREVSFTTAFVRPDRFRSEYQSKLDIGDTHPVEVAHRYIVWRQGAEVRSWWDIDPGVHSEPSLGRALARATGASGIAAHTVPVLLMAEEVGGSSLKDLREPTRLEDAKIGEVLCFRIHGKYAGEPVTLWIDPATFLMRRIDSGHNFDDFCTEESTTYEAMVNNRISDEKLAFAPPKQR